MIWFIGQAPSKKSKDNSGWWAPGGASDALAKLAGIPYDQLVTKAGFKNLLGYYPGQRGGGDAFDARGAQIAASAFIEGFSALDEIVFLGKKVAKAFGAADMGWLERRNLVSGQVAYLLPHPSGRNRWYNSGENRACASAFVKRILGLTE